MQLTVNGEATEVAGDTTFADLVAKLAPSPRGVAVAVNGGVVPRSSWEAVSPADGDVVEILHAAQGG